MTWSRNMMGRWGTITEQLELAEHHAALRDFKFSTLQLKGRVCACHSAGRSGQNCRNDCTVCTWPDYMWPHDGHEKKHGTDTCYCYACDMHWFNILAISGRSYSRRTLGLIIHVCIILHNMTIDDERGGSFDENYHTVSNIVTPSVN
jgi:hypothetical protein